MSRSHSLTRLPRSGSLRAPDPGPTGGLFARVLAPFFERVQLDPELGSRLADAHDQGVVVHVLRTRRVLDPIFLLATLDRERLPKPRWMHDHYAAQRTPDAGQLLEAVREGESALLFLRRPRTLISPSSSYAEPLMETLVRAQRELDRPILLLPESLTWQRRASGIRRTLLDVVFGNREAPGKLRELLSFLAHLGRAHYHIGAPINLKSFLEREHGVPDALVAKKIRWSLLHHLAREEELRAGPPSRPIAKTRQLVLHDPLVIKQLGESSNGGGLQAQRERASEILKKLSADPKLGFIRVLDAVLERAFNKIYDGVVVDEEGFRRVWAAARRGPIVLVPSHRSHADYLILSQVFFRRGLMPPHIAAGENLSIWPLGLIFQKSGAFFIRRSFRSDRLYTAVCAAYVKRLLRDGSAVEFFIEGGRSRTGRLLEPKLGILGMCVEPVLDGAIRDVLFVPVSIGYEQVIEGRSFQKELAGGKKEKEDLGALLKTPRVLRSRYGRVHVDFDEPISLAAFLAARGVGLDPPLAPDAKKKLVRDLGRRLVQGIGSVTRVTPTGVVALVLLAGVSRGIAETDLEARAERFIQLFEQLGARLSPVLGPETRREALKEALGRLAQKNLLQMLPSPDGETVYLPSDEGRLALDYYKNNLLHFVVPHALLCLAALVPDAEDHFAERSERIAGWLEHEFPAHAARDFKRLTDTTLVWLLERRVLGRQGGAILTTASGRILARDLAGLLIVFLEAFKVVLAASEQLGASALEAELVNEALRVAKKWVLLGQVRHAEAISKPLIQNAVRRLVQMGVLERGEDGRLNGVALRVASERAALERHLAAW